MSDKPRGERKHQVMLDDDEVDIFAESLEHHAAVLDEYLPDQARMARRTARYLRKVKRENNAPHK